MNRKVRGAWAGLAIAVASSGAHAEPPDLPSRLRARLPRESARRLASSDDAETRIRGYERLSAHGSPQSVAALVALLHATTPPRTARERLVIVRELTRHAGHAPAVRRALVRALMEGLGTRDGVTEDDLDALLRSAAAMGLARTGTRDADDALAGALRTVGPAARAAARAWAAYPPEKRRPLANHAGAATMAEVEVLELIADQRAFDQLRGFVRRAAPAVAARAALALTGLGDYETVPLALTWKQSAGPRRLAAAEILIAARHPDGPALVAELLGRPDTMDAGLRLALRAPSDDLLAALTRILDDDHLAARAAAAIGRIGSVAAAKTLDQRLAGPRGALAAYALARLPADAAQHSLERHLDAPGAPRGRALRALAIRAATLGAASDRAEQVARSMLHGRAAGDRAAAATWLAATRADGWEELIASDDPAVVVAVMRWVRGGVAAERAARRLGRTTSPELETALSAALAAAEARSLVPRRLLLELVEGRGPAAPLAALALAERDDETTAGDVERLLDSPDIVTRSQVALGLGARPASVAVGWLERAYRYEADASVRMAIVRSMARRPETSRRRLLELAARLDDDVAVRSAARLALSGVVLDAVADTSGAIWVDLHASGPDGAVVVRPLSGVAIPMLPDPDGLIVAGRLPSGPVDVRVAFPAEGGQARQGREP